MTKGKFKKEEKIWGWIFLIPMLAGFVLFFAFPLIYALFISMSEYDLFSPPKFTGLVNYINVFKDSMFFPSVLNVLINSLGVVIGMAFALVLSVMLVEHKPGSMFFRILYFLPTICGAVATTFIWQWMYAPSYGLIANFINILGGNGAAFNLLSKNFLLSMIIMGVWGGMGISILMFFSTLTNAPKNLYEAAMIDGANAFYRFKHITLAMVSPVTFYILVTGVIGSLQEFTRFQVMRGGVYNAASITPIWRIYQFTGTFGYQYGLASAMGVVLGLIIMVITVINFIVSRFWVNYDV